MPLRADDQSFRISSIHQTSSLKERHLELTFAISGLETGCLSEENGGPGALVRFPPKAVAVTPRERSFWTK